MWWEVLVLMDLSLLPEGSDKMSVIGMGVVSQNPTCRPQRRGAVQILKEWKVATNPLISRGYDTLQSALIHSRGSRVPDGDSGGEDRLDDGRVEVHHHCWTSSAAAGRTSSVELFW